MLELFSRLMSLFVHGKKKVFIFLEKGNVIYKTAER